MVEAITRLLEAAECWRYSSGCLIYFYMYIASWLKSGDAAESSAFWVFRLMIIKKLCFFDVVLIYKLAKLLGVFLRSNWRFVPWVSTAPGSGSLCPHESGDGHYCVLAGPKVCEVKSENSRCHPAAPSEEVLNPSTKHLNYLVRVFGWLGSMARRPTIGLFQRKYI